MDELMSGSWSQNDSVTCYSVTQDGNSENFCSARCEAMVLPLFIEVTWPHGVRAALYLIGLLYSFFGISIVSDLFMGAIEKITSSTKKITLASGGDGEGPEVIEVPVWNGTVANLTLMALGKFKFNLNFNLILSFLLDIYDNLKFNPGVKELLSTLYQPQL